MFDLISIIVPVYKVESYLRKCVDSILAQTYQNFELILVDDGSPDNCPAICDDYAVKDSRIRVIHQLNAGLSAARNTGLDTCKGNFITFIDSDDWVEPEYVKTLYDGLMEQGADIAQCGFRYVQGDKTIPSQAEELSSPLVLERGEAIDSLYIKRGKSYFNTMAWGKLYRRAIFEKLRFPVGRIHEDDFAICDILTQSANLRIALLPNVLYNYYQRTDGLNCHITPKKVMDRFVSWLYVLERIPDAHVEAREYQCGYLYQEIWKLIANDQQCYLPLNQVTKENPEFWTLLQNAVRKIPVSYLSHRHESLHGQHLTWKNFLMWRLLQWNLKIGLKIRACCHRENRKDEICKDE